MDVFLSFMPIHGIEIFRRTDKYQCNVTIPNHLYNLKIQQMLSQNFVQSVKINLDQYLKALNIDSEPFRKTFRRFPITFSLTEVPKKLKLFNELDLTTSEFYQGEILNDKKTGRGILLIRSIGLQYGTYRDGQSQGKFTMIYKDGVMISG